MSAKGKTYYDIGINDSNSHGNGRKGNFVINHICNYNKAKLVLGLLDMAAVCLMAG